MRPCLFLASKTNFFQRQTSFFSTTYFLIAARNLLKFSSWWNSTSLFYYNTFWFTMKEKVIACHSFIVVDKLESMYPKMKQKVKYQITFPLSTKRSDMPCDKTVLSGHWHSFHSDSFGYCIYFPGEGILNT